MLKNKITKIFISIATLVFLFVFTANSASAAYQLSTQFSVNSPETVVTNAQRLAAGLNVWVDGNMGFFRYSGQNRVAGSNGGQTAITTSSGSNFVNSVVTTGAPVGSLKEPADYAAGGPVYNDVANNRLLMFYHGEKNTSGGFWASIGMAVSTNGGSSWTDLGRIIKPNIAIDSPNNVGSVDVMGAPYVIKDGYFYVYFRDTLDSGLPGGQTINFTAARASVSDVLNAANSGNVASFQKYYNNSFSQPGLGGYSQNLAVGYPPMKWCDLIYLQSIDRYAVVFTSESSALSYMAVGTSQDGVNWYPPGRIGDVTTRELIYITASSDNYSNQRVVTSGNQFYIYRNNAVSEAGRWTDTFIEKFTVTFTGNPASQSNSSSSATLAPTGRQQVYLVIAVSAVLSISILATAFAISRLKPKPKSN